MGLGPDQGVAAFPEVTRDEFNAYCRGLGPTTHVVQWGNADVWKIGGKLFAVGGWADGGLGVTFKCGPVAFEVLKDMPGLRPAPYLASRGMSWIQDYQEPGLGDADLKDHIQMSYQMIARALSKKKQTKLGLVRD